VRGRIDRDEPAVNEVLPTPATRASRAEEHASGPIEFIDAR
jgi:hypothetical protein